MILTLFIFFEVLRGSYHLGIDNFRAKVAPSLMGRAGVKFSRVIAYWHIIQEQKHGVNRLSEN